MIWGLTALFPALAREARVVAAGSNVAPRRHRQPQVILAYSNAKGHANPSGYRGGNHRNWGRR
jgi:hypothetical protein